MTGPVTPLRILYTVLLCLTLTGAADAAASTGPVIGWGRDGSGQASPPDDVNGIGHPWLPSTPSRNSRRGYPESCFRASRPLLSML
jgi:hypothetical protein